MTFLRESAFEVANRSKADVPFCTANICLPTSPPSLAATG
jgi:hypothetical protein